MQFKSHRMPVRAVAFVHDLIMAAVSFVLCLMLRLGDGWLFYLEQHLLPSLALFVVICGAAFHFTGLYRGIWRYASMNDLVAIVKSVSLAILLFLLITFLISRVQGVPRTALVTNWFVLIFLLGAPRMIYRVFKDRGRGHLLERDSHLKIPVLLVGAGDAAELFIREMSRSRNAPYEVLALVDEKGTRVGRYIRDVPVMGHLDQIGDVIERLVSTRIRSPQRIILTKDLPRPEMEKLLDVVDSRGIAIARLPKITDFAGDLGANFDVRPIAIEDLLGRTQNRLDRQAMADLIRGRRILISGAGGSIGSELVRQVAALEPAHLTLIDNSEFLLYSIDMELAELDADLARRAVLADVRDRPKLDQVLAEEKPDVLFHAAALKHVPMLESNPTEAVLTNVVGTRNMADACRKAGVPAMVLISTDKAINPSNVMGATKRLAENYCQSLDILERRRRDGLRGTRFITVRFGNVLGSTGSVVPLFQRQIAQGGPVTVTHPDITRYFMTVSEAVELVLQASALGYHADDAEAGKIYVLNMGDPIKIADLATQMIRLAGLHPGEDIQIEFTGLRPGEKLHEELFHEFESLLPTSHPGLRLANPRSADYELLSRGLDELADLAVNRQRDSVYAELQRLVPEYIVDEKPGKPRVSAAAAAS